MNTVMASFNTTIRQLTIVSQWAKCLSKKNRLGALAVGYSKNSTFKLHRRPVVICSV